MFSLRIVNVDHYMSPPKSGLDLTYSQFRGSQIKYVPVVRIFGSTPTGCKTCLHIHGVFPYVLVPYSGMEDVGRFMYQLASSLDKAINVSLGTSHSKKQHVLKIVQVSGRPFYGFHSQDHQFLKIFFYNPLIIKRACDLLQNGAICGMQFQIHEGHMPFILQFFIDYNLYGMSFINLKSVVMRKDPNAPDLTPGTLTKDSVCELEADAVAVDILNRLTVEGELAVNPGLAAIWEEEKKRLQKDTLETSQRPTPRRTLSEILLMDKLQENLRFQGTCKVQLRETIPYPAITQRSTTSEILDASILDTHSLTSLAPLNVTREEVAVIDEELVLSLTQNSVTSNSLDQSLLMALDSLARQNENTELLSQNVDNDSILGSQMLDQEVSPDTGRDEEEDCDGVEYTLPLELSSDSDSTEDNNENFDVKIPQLDGIGDILEGEKKKRKKKKISRKILVDNTNENSVLLSDNDVLIDEMKRSDCWPSSVDCIDEVFSDDNNAFNNLEEDNCVQNDLINIDFVSGFDAVLRGDPSLTSNDAASSEDIFLQPQENSLTTDLLIYGKDVFVTQNKLDICSTHVPSLNNNVETADADKSVTLLSTSDDLLNTSQLDEIFNDDLNKGLNIIYERNSQLLVDEDSQFVETNSEERRFELIVPEDSLDSQSKVTKQEYCDNTEVDECSDIDIPSTQNVQITPTSDGKIELNMEADATPTKIKYIKNKKKRKLSSNIKIKMFGKKKRIDVEKQCSSYKMSRCEIEKYYKQLEFIATSLKNRNSDSSEHIIWTPIRTKICHKKETKQKNQMKKKKISNMMKLVKRYNSGLSDKEILKLTSCYVKLNRLSFGNTESMSMNYDAKRASDNKNLSKKKISKKGHDLNPKQYPSRRIKSITSFSDNAQNLFMCNKQSLENQTVTPNKSTKRVKDKISPVLSVQLKHNHTSRECGKTYNQKKVSKTNKSQADKNNLQTNKSPNDLTGTTLSNDKQCKYESHSNIILEEDQSNSQNMALPITQSSIDCKRLPITHENGISSNHLENSKRKNNKKTSNKSNLPNKLTSKKYIKDREYKSRERKPLNEDENNLQNIAVTTNQSPNNCKILSSKTPEKLKPQVIKAETIVIDTNSQNLDNTVRPKNKIDVATTEACIPQSDDITAHEDGILTNYPENCNMKKKALVNNTYENGISPNCLENSKRKNNKKTLNKNNLPNKLTSKQCIRNRQKKALVNITKRERTLNDGLNCVNKNFINHNNDKSFKHVSSAENNSVPTINMTSLIHVKPVVVLDNHRALINKIYKSKCGKEANRGISKSQDQERNTTVFQNTEIISPEIKLSPIKVNTEDLPGLKVKDSKVSKSLIVLKNKVSHDKKTPGERFLVNDGSKSIRSNKVSLRRKLRVTRLRNKGNILLNKNDNLKNKKKKYYKFRKTSTKNTDNSNKNLASKPARTEEGIESVKEVKCPEMVLERSSVKKGSKNRFIEENEQKTNNSNIKIITNKHESFKKSAAMQKENWNHNISPQVLIEKLSTMESKCKESSCNKLKTKIGMKRSLSLEFVKPVKRFSNIINQNRKRSLRIYSLDGIVDSSSSDENENNKPDTSGIATQSTPSRKRMFQSNCKRSPRTSYVPLNIEIKRSPKVKTETKTESKCNFIGYVPESDSQSKLFCKQNTATNISLSNIDDGPAEKKRIMEPFIKLEKLPESLPSTSSEQKLPTTGEIIESDLRHSIGHPQVKRLKVSIHRLSADGLGFSSQHENLSRLKKRSNRSSSLPITLKEKTLNKHERSENLGDTIADDSEEKAFDYTEKGKRVRKVLLFADDRSSENETLKGSCHDIVKEMPPRKSSLDMFELNSTPETVLSEDSERIGGPDSDSATPPFSRLSGLSAGEFSGLEEETITSKPPDDCKLSLSLNFSQKSNKNDRTLTIEKSPFDFSNTTLITPAFQPPSCAEVMSKLSEFGLPEVLNETPFCSEPADVAKMNEVGGTVLKLKSKSVVHLEEFEGAFNFLSKFKKESRSKRCFSQTNLFGNKKILITPVRRPPSALEAKEWLRLKLSLKAREEEVVEHKKITKIVLPLSPGNDEGDDDSMNDTMTLSQYTPLSKTSIEELDVNLSFRSTPETTSNKELKISPLMASTPNLRNQPSTSKKRFSRVSLGFKRSLPLIQEEEKDAQQNYLNDDCSPQAESITERVKQLSRSRVKQLLSESKSPVSTSCQIDMATPSNSGNYRMELENLQDVKLVHEYQHLTVMAIELHVHTRGELRPNPDQDAVCCVFYNITNDSPDPSISQIKGDADLTVSLIYMACNRHVFERAELKESSYCWRSVHCTSCLKIQLSRGRTRTDQLIPKILNFGGAIYVSESGREEKMPQMQCQLESAPDEQSLIVAFVALVRKWDPDIFVGYEIEQLSWGYLLQRAYVLNINLTTELSRVRPLTPAVESPREINDDDTEIRLTGRIVLNLWRFLRHEVALQSYTFENIAYHVLHQRLPLFSFRTLTNWWTHRTKMYRWQVFEHYLTRVDGTVRIMQQLDLVGRTSEFARLFGIQFYEVLSRGSQFRVESMMLRLVKPLNYVAVSPSVQQRARMRAPESLPLIMEPESRFYTDPVIVLDFQSLYPSIIIAYNYCFSTCMGRVEYLGRSEMFEFGCTQLRVPVDELSRLSDNLNLSPCGVAFVNQSVVKGVLPRMLEEILNTRLMVKQSMKERKDDKTLQRVLHARQLGLKLIANVTYGYTAANFSGRMPCIEVGDSVVSKARETLERAISLVGKNQIRWGARVIYGDTDSMFVLVPGKSREEAFRIGAEIAEAVTNDNPKPVKLKLEKVYQPCLLQTKKRYVGYMYESPGQEKPVYDAKGIETVRRDGCPAVAKILEKTLRILFETKDVSLVKRYVCRQFTKVLSGRVSIQELTFAREYRGAAGYRPGACVPALELAKQWRTVDPRLEPRAGQRVPYVIVAGSPGLPLIRLVRSPAALLADSSLKINAEYYISRVIIPPLDRCLSLIGAHVAMWYTEMPRRQQHLYLPSTSSEGGRKATISQYFVTCNCAVCECVTTSGVCAACQQNPQRLATTLAGRVRVWERKMALVNKICQSCCGRPSEIDCTSLDCPVLYRRHQACKDLKQSDYIRDLQQQYLPAL